VTRLLPGLTPELRRLVVALCTLEFLEWMGGGAIVPLLPTYLRQHGSSPALVGLVMASYFASGMLTQFPLGRLVDRLGPRPVVLGGLAAFAAGCVGFVLVPGAFAGIAFRALQGAGAGSVTVAATATIGLVLPPAGRGGAFGVLYGAQTLALAIGPLVGSIIGASSMHWLFIGAALSAGAAAVPALGVLPRGRLAAAPGAVAAPRPAGGRARALLSPSLVGAALVFAAVGLVGGLYEACWSLLLHLRGADSVEIGASWTLYCLPYALLSPGAGRRADRVDRRLLVAFGIAASAIFACVYPGLHSVVALLVFGCLESAGAVFVTPAALSVLSGAVRPDEQGAAQGLVGSARTGATAAGAAGCGALFSLSPVLPFYVAGGVLALLAAAALACWRRVPGRAAGAPRPLPVEGAERSGLGS